MVGGWKDDNGWTPEHGYTIHVNSSCEPDGSGELKTTNTSFLTTMKLGTGSHYSLFEIYKSQHFICNVRVQQ